VAPALRINWNPVSETWRNLRLAHRSLVVWRSMLGISWFWFYGTTFLAQFAGFTKDFLGGDESVTTFLLAVFSVGIGVGSRQSRLDAEGVPNLLRCGRAG
jgi:hypothetical protein